MVQSIHGLRGEVVQGGCEMLTLICAAVEVALAIYIGTVMAREDEMQWQI